MRIGIIGMGSIGQRHARCLKELGCTDVAALRSMKGSRKELPEDLGHIEEVGDIGDFYSMELDGALVCNPTALHVEAMLKPIEMGIPVFVEKPLSHDLASLNVFRGADTSKVMVGFCFRYHKTIQAIKSFIEEERLGRIYKADLYCGQYLPSWHPDVDYRNEYYARKDLGGGVLRTLSHEVDMMHLFLGDVRAIWARMGKISELEIDVEDNAFLICETVKGAMASIELDYLNPKALRRGIVQGEKGVLEYSLNDSSVTFTDNNGQTERVFNDPDLAPNHMYLAQMRGFLDLVERGYPPLCNFSDGLKVMRSIEAAESASDSGVFQTVEEEMG